MNIDPTDVLEAPGALELSVVIPTYNRLEQLQRVLVALAAQETDAAFEVVVVSDGSTDGTAEYLQSGSVPLDTVVVIQDNAGPAAARNAGVGAARGELILFVDDDVVPGPGLVEHHICAHRQAEGDVVVVGPMLTPNDATLSPWVAWEQHQLYKQYAAMRAGEYDCTFRQFFTGNASVARRRIVALGGFDTSLRRAEDVELAYRLHQSGVDFVFEPGAEGFHYADRPFDSWLRTPFEYGRNDVTFIADGQAWLRSTLPREFRGRHPLVRLLTKWCVPRPRAARIATRVLSRVGRSSTFSSVRRLALSGVYNLAYYRGVAAGLGSAVRFRRFIVGRSERDAPRVGFVLEQTLGHVAHGGNLQHLLANNDRVEVTFLEVPFPLDGSERLVPVLRNWTVRAGVRAGRLISRANRGAALDALFIHTQVPATLNARWMRRVPTVVSIDATPLQYDALGEHYAHEPGPPAVESFKYRLHRRCFERARHVVAWSEWAADSLESDYGVPREHISVIAPGVDVDRWARPETSLSDASSFSRRPRVLFVGGDFERKGGRTLLDATRTLRSTSGLDFELHLVTRDDVAQEPGVIVHRNMTPNSPELIRLYHSCDIFCLPTRGDCLPMVLSEAAIAGLALISTDVGAIREIVTDEVTGLLVPIDDAQAIGRALGRLLEDVEFRTTLATAAAALVRRQFDAAANADRLAALMADVASEGR